MQTESTPMEVKKDSKFSLVTVFVIIFLLAAIGLGAWGYTLNNNLTKTQAGTKELQKKFDTLTADKDAVSGNLDQARTDLEKAEGDLAKAKKDLTDAEASLTKSKEDAVTLQGNIDKSLQYLDIAIGIYVDQDNVEQRDAKVKAINDPELTKKYEAMKVSDGTEAFSDFLTYLFVTMTKLVTVK